MNIGQAAKLSNINSKLIRHYESIGIIPKAQRTSSGYRVYSDSDVNILKFVKKSRDLGFPMKDIKKLVSLWRNQSRASKEVKSLAEKHIQEMEDKIRTLKILVKTLKDLSIHCKGDDRPDCPIIQELATERSKR